MRTSNPKFRWTTVNIYTDHEHFIRAEAHWSCCSLIVDRAFQIGFACCLIGSTNTPSAYWHSISRLIVSDPRERAPRRCWEAAFAAKAVCLASHQSDSFFKNFYNNFPNKNFSLQVYFACSVTITWILRHSLVQSFCLGGNHERIVWTSLTITGRNLLGNFKLPIWVGINSQFGQPSNFQRLWIQSINKTMATRWHPLEWHSLAIRRELPSFAKPAPSKPEPKVNRVNFLNSPNLYINLILSCSATFSSSALFTCSLRLHSFACTLSLLLGFD